LTIPEIYLVRQPFPPAKPEPNLIDSADDGESALSAKPASVFQTFKFTIPAAAKNPQV
jgi:hypothetical protein